MLLKGLFRSIFCIDDNETDRFIAEKYLNSLFVNPEITLFANGEAAIDHLIRFKRSEINWSLDYILLDLNMPHLDGWEFLDEIYRLKIDLWCQSAVYIVSSSVGLENLERSKMYPIVKGFITKPLSRPKFRSSLLGAY